MENLSANRAGNAIVLLPLKFSEGGVLGLEPFDEENAEMIQPSSTRVTPSPGNKILQDLRQSARQRDRHPALPAKGHAEGTGDGSNLQGPSGAKYSENDVSRPAWQYLPDHDAGDEPSRSDYRNAGFRMLPRQPVDVRS